MSTGAFFGLGPLEIGMKLEDAAYEQWREWAKQETIARRQLESAAYTGDGAEEVGLEIEEVDQPILQEVAESVPGSKGGQTARGGAAIHP
jgi:small subunit ribosomal protein S23